MPLCTTERREWRPWRRPVFQTSSSTLYISWTGRVNRHPQSITCYYPSGPHFCLNKSSVVYALHVCCALGASGAGAAAYNTGDVKCQDARSCHFHPCTFWKFSKEYKSSLEGHWICSQSHFPLKHESWISVALQIPVTQGHHLMADGQNSRSWFHLVCEIVFFTINDPSWRSYELFLEAHPAGVGVSPLM